MILEKLGSFLTGLLFTYYTNTFQGDTFSFNRRKLQFAYMLKAHVVKQITRQRFTSTRLPKVQSYT